MQLHALPLQPPGADGAKAETTGQELQPDGGEQGGRLEGAAETICVAGLAALLLHAGDQHHNLMERLQPQLDIKKHPRSGVDVGTEEELADCFYSDFWLRCCKQCDAIFKVLV